MTDPIQVCYIFLTLNDAQEKGLESTVGKGTNADKRNFLLPTMFISYQGQFFVI